VSLLTHFTGRLDRFSHKPSASGALKKTRATVLVRIRAVKMRIQEDRDERIDKPGFPLRGGLKNVLNKIRKRGTKEERQPKKEQQCYPVSKLQLNEHGRDETKKTPGGKKIESISEGSHAEIRSDGRRRVAAHLARV